MTYTFAVGASICVTLFGAVLMIGWGLPNTLERAGIWMLHQAARLRRARAVREEQQRRLLQTVLAEVSR